MVQNTSRINGAVILVMSQMFVFLNFTDILRRISVTWHLNHTIHEKDMLWLSGHQITFCTVYI